MVVLTTKLLGQGFGLCPLSVGPAVLKKSTGQKRAWILPMAGNVAGNGFEVSKAFPRCDVFHRCVVRAHKKKKKKDFRQKNAHAVPLASARKHPMCSVRI